MKAIKAGKFRKRVGQWREHSRAWLRVGPIGFDLAWHMPYGWKAEFHVTRRLGFEIAIGVSQNDWRFTSWSDYVMPPSKVKLLTQAREDFDSGRGYRFHPNNDDMPMEPLATWRPDDPKQPDGWHHDGKKWVMNETGWFRDRTGFMRYNHPGDPGWKENDDGSWRYVKASDTVTELLDRYDREDGPVPDPILYDVSNRPRPN